MSKHRMRTLAIILFAFCILLQAKIAGASTILQTVDIPGSYVFRILGGSQPDEYWIVDVASGLRLLYQDALGHWACSAPYGNHLQDATGPDSQGRIYCTDYSASTGSYIWVFDCNQRSVISTIYLGPDYPLRGLCLSPDESSLFVLGYNWPRIGQHYSGFIASAGHPDAGIVWQIDTATGTIVDQGVCDALPETIFCASSEEGPDRLFISTQTTAASDQSAESSINVLSVERGLPRLSRIWALASLMPYRLDFLKWSTTDSYIAAISGADDSDPLPGNQYAIIIIDSSTGSVVNRLSYSWNGHIQGINHAFLSQVDPSKLYASINLISPTGHSSIPIAVLDHDTGALLDTIPVGDVDAQFIYEMPDGKLIVTTGKDGKILIIDPT